MPWRAPPAELRHRVNRVLGQDVYQWAEGAYNRVLGEFQSFPFVRDPAESTVPFGSWWRTPEHHRTLPGAAAFSQHPLGFAVDVTPVRGEYERTAAAFRRQGFYVLERQGRAAPYLHVQVFNPERFRRVLPDLVAAGIVPPGGWLE